MNIAVLTAHDWSVIAKAHAWFTSAGLASAVLRYTTPTKCANGIQQTQDFLHEAVQSTSSAWSSIQRASGQKSRFLLRQLFCSSGPVVLFILSFN